MIITSPPYNIGKEYVNDDPEQQQDNLSDEEYYGWVKKWLAACHHVLCDGGKIAINVPFIAYQRKAKHIVTYVDRYTALLKETGFSIRDMVVWVKTAEENTSVMGGNDTSWGSFMSPNAVYIRTFAEPIIIAHKGSKTRNRKKKNDITKEEFMKFTKNTWYFLPEHRRAHPAPFPSELPRRLIKLYTWPGDLVVDPMCGSGTTLVEAARLGRHYIGIDSSKKYCGMARKRVFKEVNQEVLSPWLLPTTTTTQSPSRTLIDYGIQPPL